MSTEISPISDDRAGSIESRSSNITTEEARERLKSTLFSALRTGTNTLVEAPTAVGKSHQIATTPWQQYPEVTGDKPVIHFHATTDARKEAVERSANAPKVDYDTLKGREDTCDVAKGMYDDEVRTPDGSDTSKWLRKRCDRDRIKFAEAHSHLLELNGGLPCCEDGTCDAFSQWERVMASDVDIIHTTTPFAHVDGLIEDANLIFDEQPDYEVTFNSAKRDHIRQSASNLLHDISDGEYTLDSVLDAVRNGDEKTLDEIKRYLSDGLPEGWLFSREETHRLAAKIVRAVASATEMWNDRYRGKADNVTVVFDDCAKIRLIHKRPDLEKARCFVGLDAYPSPLQWEANTTGDIEQNQLLSNEERRYWRIHERGLQIRQLGTASRSLSTGWQSDGEKQRAEGIIRRLRERHGQQFRTAISASEVEEDVVQLMGEAGVRDPETMHYGEEKSRDGFGDESVGLLVGCIDPGDDPVLDWLAFYGLEARPETEVVKSGEEKRVPGRGFEGPDADAAAEILASIRENHLAQSAGRYARNPDSEDSGAIVYVWSSALPDRLTDVQLGVALRRITPKKEAILEAVEERGTATRREVQQEVGSSKSYTKGCLDEMADQGVLRRHESLGKNGADVYEYISGEYTPSVTISASD